MHDLCMVAVNIKLAKARTTQIIVNKTIRLAKQLQGKEVRTLEVIRESPPNLNNNSKHRKHSSKDNSSLRTWVQV